MGKWGLGLIFFALVIFQAFFVNAYSFESYETEFYVVDENVLVKTNLDFKEKFYGQFFFAIPSDAETIEIMQDGNKIEYKFENNELIFNLISADKIYINYITQEYTDQTSFIFDFSAPADIESLTIRVVLPERATLKKPITKTSPGSVFPNPKTITSDGLSMIFEWDASNMKEGDGIAFYTSYRLEKRYTFVYVLMAILVIAILVIGVIALKKKEKIIVKKEKEDIAKHLKEDEEIIVNVLKQRDKNSCEQGTLRVITGFSKATLSRLLKELEERKIVYKEKRGKKNLIFLK